MSTTKNAEHQFEIDMHLKMQSTYPLQYSAIKSIRECRMEDGTWCMCLAPSCLIFNFSWSHREVTDVSIYMYNIHAFENTIDLSPAIKSIRGWGMAPDVCVWHPGVLFFYFSEYWTSVCNQYIEILKNAIDLSPAIKNIRECTMGDSITWCMCLAPSCFYFSRSHRCINI